jgi:hypothetical protein
MAIDETRLTLTGCFPGAQRVAQDVNIAAGAGRPFYTMNGAIAIPLNSIRYSGSTPNHTTNFGDGTVPSLTAGSGHVETQVGAAGDIDGRSTAGFRNFARGVHESLCRYTAENLTGVNTISKWGESSGNYVVATSQTLSRQYQTTLYYDIDSTVLSAGI